MRPGITIEKKIMQRGIMWKDTLKSSHETMDFGKTFMQQGILLGNFYATGHRVLSGLPHTPVIS